MTWVSQVKKQSCKEGFAYVSVSQTLPRRLLPFMSSLTYRNEEKQHAGQREAARIPQVAYKK